MPLRLILHCKRSVLILLDDQQGLTGGDRSLTLFRLSLDGLVLEHATGRLVVRATELSLDNHNRRLFGWEPLLERWRAPRLALTFAGRNKFIVELQSKEVFDLTVTECSVELARFAIANRKFINIFL
jgi:hypothetical protein